MDLATTPQEREARDLAILNVIADELNDELNKEAEDVLDFQAAELI